MPQYPHPSATEEEDVTMTSAVSHPSPQDNQLSELQLVSHQDVEGHHSPAYPGADSSRSMRPEMANAEELQLAAQLSQNLSSFTSGPPVGDGVLAAAQAPMNHHQHHLEHDFTLKPSRQPTPVDTSHTSGQDPVHEQANDQEHGQGQLPAHHLSHASFGQSGSALSHQTESMQIASLASTTGAPPMAPQRAPVPQMHAAVLPRPPHTPPPGHIHPTQPSQYAQDHQQPVLTTHLTAPIDARHQLATQYAVAVGEDASNSARKRSKVSRACDECRRKKVKCDARSENGDPCSNCRRSNIDCLFSRVPQKRGPSKGYIKELAERLQCVENKIYDSPSSGAPVVAPGNVDSSLMQQTPDAVSRKRRYSSISTGPLAQLSGWAPDSGPPSVEASKTKHAYNADGIGLLPNDMRQPACESDENVQPAVASASAAGSVTVTEPDGLRTMFQKLESRVNELESYQVKQVQELHALVTARFATITKYNEDLEKALHDIKSELHDLKKDRLVKACNEEVT